MRYQNSCDALRTSSASSSLSRSWAWKTSDVRQQTTVEPRARCRSHLENEVSKQRVELLDNVTVHSNLVQVLNHQTPDADGVGKELGRATAREWCDSSGRGMTACLCQGTQVWVIFGHRFALHHAFERADLKSRRRRQGRLRTSNPQLLAPSRAAACGRPGGREESWRRRRGLTAAFLLAGRQPPRRRGFRFQQRGGV